MKRKIISGIKIYTICIIYIIIISLIYSSYLIKTNNNSSNIFELIFGISTFILIGILYGNMVHKKGLFVGLISGIIHLIIINFIIYILTNELNLNFILILIYISSSALGGILGLTFKKII